MKIGRIFGIEITVHVTWLFVFGLVAWSLGSSVGPFRGYPLTPLERATLAIGTALLFFASVLVHELSHSLVARSAGIPVKGITLFIFGGVSRFGEDPRTARIAAWTAFVGPLTSLVIGALFFALYGAIGLHSPVGKACAYLAGANVVLGVFNLVPAFPLDGGRVLHALVWLATKDRLRATRVAVTVGRVFAGLIIAWGIVETLAYNAVGGVWMTFIGWFLLQAGNAEGLQAELQTSLAGHTARELATRSELEIPADVTAETALRMLLEAHARAAPVMVGDRLIGFVSFGDFAKDAQTPNSERYVTAVMTRADDAPSVGPDTRAADVMRKLGETGYHQVPVIDAEGTYLGMITGESVMRWMALEREHHVRAAVERHA